MFTVISGLLVFCAGSAGFWYFKPREGAAPAVSVATPPLDTLLPIGIVALLSVGTALIIAGVFG